MSWDTHVIMYYIGTGACKIGTGVCNLGQTDLLKALDLLHLLL